MSEPKDKLRLFEGMRVRSMWDDEAEKRWLSNVGVCVVLTDCDYQAARK